LVVESRCSFKINPDNGVEAIKGMQDALTRLLAGIIFRKPLRKNNYSVDELMTDLKRFF
jgi:hypothetical protein